MKIWHYCPATSLLLGAGVADPSPLEPDVWLVPAFAATTPPPDAIEGHEVAYENGAWVQREIAALPPLEPLTPPAQQPTKAELMAQLQAIAAQIAALPK